MFDMFKLTYSFLIVLLLVSCEEKAPGQRTVTASSGNINNLNVIVSNDLWEGAVGESIRDLLAAPYVGLPQDEPMFSINQMPPEVFSGFAAKNRIVLKIETEKEPQTVVKLNLFAKPQTVVVVGGKNQTEIIEQLTTNSATIVDALKRQELVEKQGRIGISLKETTEIEEQLGITLNFPSVYRYAKNEDKFFWVRKTLTTGTLDFMLYEVPLDSIRSGDSAVIDIIKIRDFYGEKYIEGDKPTAYMSTEMAFSPYVFQTTIDGKPTIETRGVWRMKNDFMGGPFVNYAIEDKANNRYLIAEGYVYAPSVKKRDYVHEIEAILTSITFK
jgi:hypothetical protein